ncbi:MAG TPA: sugar ABC transporter substrate-binding protein [Anaerolineales bacterium]|nr:sugar ABC transporter substrate-binding protein [Anaerolineales bacterium]
MYRLKSITLVLLLALTACQLSSPTPAPTQSLIKLRFTYWGSEMEKAAIEQMVVAFETANPDVYVEPIQIPYEGYIAQVTAMMQNGQSPDVGYLPGLQAPLWAQEGKLLDLTDLIQNDPLLSTTLLASRYYYAPGKVAGVNTAVEATFLFYNKALFEEAGVPYPPSDPTQAWTWDEFVAAAEKLTSDVNGKHPGEAGFDPEQVSTYGVAFDKTYEGWTFYPFIFSNGGQLVNEDGTRLLLDSPEATEAMQKLADLMWVQHVAPTPTQDQNLPGYVTMLQTGNLAMHISGHWSLLDYAAVKDLEFGVAVLPKFKKPATVVLGSPTVIFAATQNKDAAIRFYNFHNNPEAVDLFARGLWMPLQKSYYTEPDKMNIWLDNPAHPAEARPAFTDYILNYSMPIPSYYLRNYAQVLDVALRPAIDSIWNNEASAVEAFAEAVKTAEPLMQGRWDR